MKAVHILFGATLCLVMGCNNDKNPGNGSVTREDGKTMAAINPNERVQTDEETQQRIEKLQKLSPYTLDQMKGFLPQELSGTKRSKFSAKSVLGTAYSEGEYEINDSTKVELKLFDCAGPAGVGIYNSQFLSLLNFQPEDGGESSKTIDFNGAKAIEQTGKNGSRSTLSYMAADRLFVTWEGENISTDQLKELARSVGFR